MTKKVTKRASEDDFNHLHYLLTDLHIARLESGDVNANDLKAAGDWLVKNGISGIATPTSKLGKLLELVPDIEEEDVTTNEGNYGT